MTGLEVTELHTQDGWDWPNGVAHEHWPAQPGRRAVPQPVACLMLAECLCEREGRARDLGCSNAHHP